MRREIQINRIPILLALLLITSANALATDLSGQVVEVIDGNTISLKSLNHTIKVRLLAVAPPAPSQPYADVARQHLADLILRKYVVLRYTGIGERGDLVGRVLLERADINAQMIRDGVAWYYQPEATDLSAADRELYPACEKAARSERRGLWQDQSPMPPWEFRSAQLAAQLAAAAGPAKAAVPRAPAEMHLPRSSRTRLSSEDVIGGALAPGAIAGKPELRNISSGGVPGTFIRYQPQDKHFSVIAPADGIEVTYPVLAGDGKLAQMRYVFGTVEGTVCILGYTKESSGNANDDAAIDGYLEAILSGMNHSLRNAGSNYEVNSGFIRNLQVTGYAGKMYRLNGSLMSGVVRIYSKKIGGEREFLMLMGLGNEGLAMKQFLESLTLAPSR
jgi:endonuclease YncB( thermonuclease family)